MKFEALRRLQREVEANAQSLVFKNIAAFIAILLVVVVPIGYTYLRSVERLLTDSLAAQIELVGQRGSAMLDAGAVSAIAAPADADTREYREMRRILKRIQDDYEVDNAVLYRRVSDRSYVYIADGSDNFAIGQHVDLHDEFPASYVAANQAWDSGELGKTSLFSSGDFKWFQSNVPIKLSGRVVALLLINKFATPVAVEIERQKRIIAIGVGVVALLGMAAWGTFTAWSLRPLRRLRNAAIEISAGNLDVEIRPVQGHNEVARLNASFRTMVGELRQSRAALEGKNAELERTLARVQLMEDLERSLLKLVPRSVRHALRADPAALERGKREADVTVLFLDVEGSSVLSEAMDAEPLDHLIESYFSHFLDCIYEYQGDITETAGDGLMILFQGDDPAAHALNAVRTGAAIQRVAGELSAGVAAGPGLSINIGVSSGAALVGFTRYESVAGARVTFTASGRTTIIAARLQQLARGGSVLLSAETARRVANVEDLASLGLRLEDQGVAELKNLHYEEHVHRLTYVADWSSGPGGSAGAAA
jgi:class 3 adenylate cyclase